jgi:hypothetical protein
MADGATGGSTSLRALQIVVGLLGATAVVTGLVDIIGGPEALPGVDGAVDETVDNAFRFNAAFWCALGVAALWLVPRLATETTAVRWVAGALFLGGVARAVSLIDVGEPHEMFVALMFVELLLPPVIVFWQSRLAVPDRAPRS